MTFGSAIFSLHAVVHREYLVSDEFMNADLLVYSDDVRKFLEDIQKLCIPFRDRQRV